MGINVLSEWAYHMTISEKDVIEERQVIAAEYMAKQGLSNRLLKKYWKAIFGSSDESESSETNLLSKRFPIGIPEVFMNCDNEQIRRFYQKWYRPENMSVLVCGDLHSRQEEILALLDNAFAQPESIPVTPITPVSRPLSESHITRCQLLQDQYLSLPNFQSKGDVVVAMVDSHLTSTQICFEFFSPVLKSKTKDFIRQDIIRRLMSSILDKRFNELHKTRGSVPSDAITMSCGTDASNSYTESPFLSVQISIREFVRGLVCIGVSATLKDISEDDSSGSPDQQGTLDVAVKSLLLEMKRLRCLGANLHELEKAKLKWLTFFSQQKNKSVVDNSYMMSELQNFVLNGENVPFASPSAEAQMCIDIIQSISLEEINIFLRNTFDMDVVPSESDQYYNVEGDNDVKRFRALSGQFPRPFPVGISEDDHLRKVLEISRTAVAGVEELEVWPSNVHIDESQVLDFARQALYHNDNSVGTGDLPSSIEEKIIESLDCSEFVLANGIAVCCKWMPEESQNKISMQGFALGGSSELTPVQDLLMSGLDEIAGHSSCVFPEGSESDTILEGNDVLELQSVANSRVNTQRHQHHRGIGGSCTSDKLELLLAFLVIKMTSQSIDLIHFEDWINKKNAQMKHPSNSPEFKFMDRSRVLACGDEPNFRPITLELIQEASECYDETCELYKRAFMVDPTEFSFVFTGDIGDKTRFSELLVKYLGKLQPNTAMIDRHGRWLQSSLESNDDKSDSNLVINDIPRQYPFKLLGSSSVDINSPIEESMHLLNKDDNKSSMMMIFRADMRHFVDDDDGDLAYTTALDATCRVLQAYLLDELRIKLGKVYNVNVEKSRSSLCTFFLISIGLHCQPSDMEVVQQSLKSVLTQLQDEGPEMSKLSSVTEAMCKTHNDASSNSSYWLFWILDSYKAYKLYEWRWQHNSFKKDTDQIEPSCKWLERNGFLRASGAVSTIKNEVTCSVVQNIFQNVFDLNKSIIMNLMPEHSDDVDDIDDNESSDTTLGQLHASQAKERRLVEVS
jgi:predicted Zn-dependent peptidase